MGDTLVKPRAMGVERRVGGRSAVVTGASAGIGRAAAVALAREGYTVVVGARRVEALESLAGEGSGVRGQGSGVDAGDGGRSGGGRIVALRLDVTDEGSVAEFAARVREVLGGVPDVLVNNAGFGVSGPVEGVSMLGLRRQFEVNVFGVHAVTRAFVSGMRERGSGRVINVSSLVGKVAFPFQGAYCASKHALEGLSDSLRMELAPFGVQVVLVEPGPIRTEFEAVVKEEIDCDEGVRGAYPGLAGLGALFEKFYKSAPGPEGVARAIVRAAGARRPWARYRVPGVQVGGAIRFFAVLPTRVADAMKRGIYGHKK